MDKWYQAILNKIKKYDSDLLLVEDKKSILKSSDLNEEIKKLYPVIIDYTNELQLRARLRKTSGRKLIIIKGENYFPTDLANENPIVKISYQDIFPNLDSEVLNCFSISEIQELFYIYNSNTAHFNILSYVETFTYITRNLYDVDFPFSRQEQLIAFLIKYYFTNKSINPTILKYLTDHTPNYRIEAKNLSNKESFYLYLNQEWRDFINKDNSMINFNDQSIKYLLNDCFDQGLMKAIDLLEEEVDTEYLISEAKANYWINIGISNMDKFNVLNSVQSDTAILKDLLEKDLTVRDWGNIAKIWSKLVYLNSLENLNISIHEIRERLDNRFYQYIEDNYDLLAYHHSFYNAPLNNRIISHISEDNAKKIALICFDGMSFKEWPAIKEYLYDKLSISFKEEFSIAMIPTVTKYSRRAIFSGKLPIEDDGIGTEEKAFINAISRKFSIMEEEVFFERVNNPLSRDFLGYKAVGLIYNFVDDLSHSAQNQKMLIDNINDNLNNFDLDKVISSLLKDGFKIFFASDHGNVFAKGNKYNPRKSLVEERASRAVLYDTENLARNEEFENKLILRFPNILGDNYIVTMKDRRKFGNREAGFTHGGINIEEVIIPFIEVIK
ncbi:BREX-3 system phosphatase PglZ [Natronospora cellulosivora (SeqCode)]